MDGTLKQWQELAEEAQADARYWKREARDAQARYMALRNVWRHSAGVRVIATEHANCGRGEYVNNNNNNNNNNNSHLHRARPDDSRANPADLIEPAVSKTISTMAPDDSRANPADLIEPAVSKTISTMAPDDSRANPADLIAQRAQREMLLRLARNNDGKPFLWRIK